MDEYIVCYCCECACPPLGTMVAVRATAIVTQPVNPCQGQSHGAAWPLRLSVRLSVAPDKQKGRGALLPPRGHRATAASASERTVNSNRRNISEHLPLKEIRTPQNLSPRRVFRLDS